MSIPAAEVRKHKTKNSAWMIINNDVYDVTAFLNEHPGGEDTLLEYAGKDGTRAFEDVGHSPDARELMKKFKIGSLHPQERKIFVDPCRAVTPKSSFKETPSVTSCGRVNTIVVPRERSEIRTPPPPPPPPPSNKWKWIALALGLAIIAGVAARRYYAPG